MGSPQPPDSADTFPGVIKWPCGEMPYSKTIRAHIAKTQLFVYPIAVFLALVVWPFAWLVILDSASGQDVAYPMLIATIIGGACWIVYFVLMVWPIRSVFRGGAKHCEAWRQRWLQLEHHSAAFVVKARIAWENAGVEIPLEELPRLPNVQYNLHDFKAIPFPTVNLPTNEQSQIDEMVAAMESLMLHSLVQLGGDQVVFRGHFSAPCVGTVTMCGPCTQFWALYTVNRNGSVLAPRLELGFQHWVPPMRLADGATYLGDLRLVKQQLYCLDSVLIVVMVLAAAALLPLGLFGMGALIFCNAGPVLRQLTHRDRAETMRYAMDVTYGDSADLAALQKFRRTPTGFGVTVGDRVEQHLAALREQVIVAAHAASSLTIRQ